MKVVALGGGHGLAATLRAVRLYADDITAIVSVADDGGSSGRLREAFGLPAPGDLRKCLVALAKDEGVWSRVFEHRFAGGELDGHSLGNLIIAGLTAATGDFATALEEAGRVLGAVGRVLPATIEPVVLKAEVADGAVEGQVAVQNSSRISCVSLVPPDPAPPAEAVAALADADQIILGPGSLFTSVIAVVAVPTIRAAVNASPARTVYVANLRPQVPETADFDVAAHVAALAAHRVIPDVVLYDPAHAPGGDRRTDRRGRLGPRRWRRARPGTTGNCPRSSGRIRRDK
jgi:uncharacterized cofD-like protein